MDDLTALRRRERAITVVRWIVALFLVAQVLLGRVRPLAVLLVALLVVAGVVAEWATRAISSASRMHDVGLALLAADVGVALAFIFLFGFDPVAGQWGILILLPLEGAVRFQLRGAMLVAAVVAPAYLGREMLVEPGPPAALAADVVAYRLGVMILIAGFAGYVTRDLEGQRRLLQGLNAASASIAGRLEPAEILLTLCQETVTCLDAQSAVVYVSDGQWFQPVAAWPAEALPTVLAEDEGEREDPALARALVTETTWLEPDQAHPGRLVVPIWRGDGLAADASLLVIRPRRGRLKPFQQDAAVSLAELAARTLATTRVLELEQRSNRRLRYLEALRTRFVATVAHDLRMPLTVFKGVARLLRNRGDEIPIEQVHSMLATVERQANRLSRLADDLLDAARLDADKLTLKLERCDVRTVIRAAVADAEEAVEVRVDGDLSVVADAVRLERVLWNLLSNGEKYGRPPYVVRAWRDEDDIVISVRDHGPGLDEEQRRRLFQDFAGSDDAASVGLGLAIVWQLVEAHGGHTAYEHANPGARFVVRLPVGGPAGAR